MELKVTCDVATRLNYKDLKPTQGELKTLSRDSYENLRKSIIKYGIHSALSAWKSPEGELQILDGHQRVLTFAAMEKEGFKIPPIPVVTIEAPDFDNAKEIILTLISQYGKVDTQGLYEFMANSTIKIKDLSGFEIPNVNLDKFEVEYFKDVEVSPDDAMNLTGPVSTSISPATGPTDKVATEQSIGVTEKIVECPKCAHSFLV